MVLLGPLEALVGRPVLIALKSDIIYRGKMTAGPAQEMIIKNWMPREGVILEDGTFISFSNIASISPRAI